MKVLIIGAGTFGEIQIKHMKSNGYEIAVMDIDSQKCEDISNQYDVLVFKGDVTDMDDLNEVKVADYDFFITATGDSEKNILGGLLAKELGAKRVIARIHDPRLSKIAEKLNITNTICPEIAAVEKILEIIRMESAHFSKRKDIGRV